MTDTAITSVAEALAEWAVELDPSEDDLALAHRSLLDTVAVMYAARADPLRDVLEPLGQAGRWSALAHVGDFDDLHMQSTTHISAVCVPVALATDGGARAYLAGAGVMARLGAALSWNHYQQGWHATTTAGAPAAAAAAAVARGLDGDAVARAIALAVPAAGGVQRPFGTMGKALQVGFAADAGVRAAGLAEAGATANPRALDQWLALVGGDPEAVTLDGPAVPGGLAIKLFPCCYALQRPINALAALGPPPAAQVRSVRVTTPAVTLTPLVHHRPTTASEAQFSLEYGLAATLLDGAPGFDSFTDDAVRRPEARRLIDAVEVSTTVGGDHLLAGEAEIEVELADGSSARSVLAIPPGAPERPPSELELRQKLEACAGEVSDELAALTWETAAAFLRARL
jgi:2-methylcitrate dehydratase PrpD